MADPDADVLKTYKAINELGEGGFGKVLLVEDMRNGRRLAMKMIPVKDGELDDKSGISEQRFLKALKDVEGIPILYDYFLYNKTHFIITPLQLCDFLTFMKRNPGCRFQKNTLIQIGVDLLSILKQMHGLGVVHRDVKPDNLMLGPSVDNAKLSLCDFGLAVRYTTAGGVKLRAPKEDYVFEMALHSTPEMTRGLPPTPVDDVTMTGYCLTFMSGIIPFNDSDPDEKLLQKLRFRSEPKLFLNGHSEFLVPFVEQINGLDHEAVDIDYDGLIMTLKAATDKVIEPYQTYNLVNVSGQYLLP